MTMFFSEQKKKKLQETTKHTMTHYTWAHGFAFFYVVQFKTRNPTKLDLTS